MLQNVYIHRERQMSAEASLVVRIELRNRGSYFSAKSPNLPGLHVCGETVEAVRESAITAIKYLFKHNKKMDVEVLPVAADYESFPELSRTLDKLIVQQA